MVVRIRKFAPRVRSAERRKNPRKQAAVIPYLKEAQLVAGPKVRLINVSRKGALLETQSGLRPGSLICLRIITADAIMMLKGCVVRSRAVSLNRSRLTYQSAIEFESEFPLADVQLFGESELLSAGGPINDSQENPSPETSSSKELPSEDEPERAELSAPSDPDDVAGSGGEDVTVH